jgi:hypothetical protein
MAANKCGQCAAKKAAKKAQQQKKAISNPVKKTTGYVARTTPKKPGR